MSSDRTVPPPLTGLRVLIVDDHRDVANSMATALSFFGVETCVAYSGEDAVEFARGFRPDAVILDISMPNVDGYEVCRRIRRMHRPNARVCVIAMTGHAVEHDKAKAILAGFSTHLAKPVSIHVLHRVLSEVPLNAWTEG